MSTATLQVTRRGTAVATFEVPSGTSLFDALLGRHVPPEAAVITRDGEPVSAFEPAVAGARYTVDVLEGYDLGAYVDAYDAPPDGPAIDTLRRFSFDGEGGLRRTVEPLDEAGLVDYVEGLVADTVAQYDLAAPGDRLLVALSGETDSTAMLLALAASRSTLEVDLETVTVREPRGEESAAFRHAAATAESLGLDHRTVDLPALADLYGLDRPIRDAFDDLAGTRFERRAVTVMDTVHRRAFEHVAETGGFDKVCHGKHVTEFVAGLLTGATTGVEAHDLPSRRVGEVTYVHPVAFLDKRKLALYHRARTGDFAPRSAQNMWDDAPAAQGFMQYLADLLRSYWPGVGHWLVEARLATVDRRGPDAFTRCPNCDKWVLREAARGPRCLACRAFEAVGAV